MKKKPNFEKASVSLPLEVHEWLKSEAARRAELYGESWSVSRIIQEAIREYRSRIQSTSQPRGQAMPDWTLNEDPTRPQSGSANIIRPSVTYAGGSSIAPTKASRRAGKAK